MILVGISKIVAKMSFCVCETLALKEAFRVRPFRFLIAKYADVCVNWNPAEWKLNLGFGTHKSVPFPKIKVTDTKIMGTFFWDQLLCPLNGSVP